MKGKHKINFLSVLGAILMVSLSACNGILDDIYDEPENKDSGFLSVSDGIKVGTVYIDATDYMDWIYIDFHRQVTDSLRIDTVSGHAPQADPSQWDIAVHRYDVRTNGATALETEYTDFSVLKTSGTIPSDEFKADEMSKVTVDMSHMMDENGYLVTVPAKLNLEIGKWLNVDKSTMPPIYTPSGKIYLVKFSDGTYVALRLSNFMNGKGVKGFMTIDYIYPYKP